MAEGVHPREGACTCAGGIEAPRDRSHRSFANQPPPSSKMPPVSLHDAWLK